ncbi:hypothetical protein [Alkalilimnicola ehrlichii]|uniref:hypothetical protein n=1 Tax=Alkalilimnicola ehrlichii TaxID=351052 RepID=UPI0021628B48|nr:hypothetical protein [Alkalilimnicola ehrlichii]
MEHSALLQILWNMESDFLPKVIDFSIDYLRPGRPETILPSARCSGKGNAWLTFRFVLGSPIRPSRSQRRAAISCSPARRSRRRKRAIHAFC